MDISLLFYTKMTKQTKKLLKTKIELLSFFLGGGVIKLENVDFLQSYLLSWAKLMNLRATVSELRRMSDG